MDTHQKNNFLKSRNSWQIAAIGLAVLFAISLSFNFFEIDIVRKNSGGDRGSQQIKTSQESSNDNEIISAVLPREGIKLPITWGDLGKRLTEAGVIDKEKFEALYARRGGLDKDSRRLLEAGENSKVVVSEENAETLLNFLWAFGLGNKNPILEEGPMTDSGYGEAGNFASTGGWTLSQGSAMDHYSKHEFVVLTPQQQELVERVSKSIFRPCCGNSTYFPDCNHGMAMLGLLQLMAAQEVSEAEMYKVALRVNSYWFPQTYLTIAKYFEKQGTKWPKVDPKLALGESFSSASGYRRVLSEVEPVQSGSGGGCGV